MPEFHLWGFRGQVDWGLLLSDKTKIKKKERKETLLEIKPAVDP